jgi:hypothetical protein
MKKTKKEKHDIGSFYQHRLLVQYIQTLRSQSVHILRGDQLRKSARMEFEQSRFESDPETVARMLLTARQCLLEVQHQVGMLIQ